MFDEIENIWDTRTFFYYYLIIKLKNGHERKLRFSGFGEDKKKIKGNIIPEILAKMTKLESEKEAEKIHEEIKENMCLEELTPPKLVLDTNEIIKKPEGLEENIYLEEPKPPQLVLDKEEIEKVDNVVYCSNCGIVLSIQSNYCNNCGTDLRKTRIAASNKEESLVMEASGVMAKLQLFDTKIKIIELTFTGKIKAEREIPLSKMQSINFTECGSFRTGRLQFTIEAESGGVSESVDSIIWDSTKGKNYQFKLINEAILQKKGLIKGDFEK